MEAKIEERTEELKRKNDALESALQHLKTTQTQLIQAEKMASLGELTAGIAHEIKNPLNFINNFAQLNVEIIRELRGNFQDLGNSPEEDVGDMLDNLELNANKISQHGQRADRIVRSMMEHASGSPGAYEPTELNMLLRESVELAYHGMRAQHAGFNVVLNQSFEEGNSMLSARRQELSRVFINLLNNAFYAVMEKDQAGIPDYVPTVSLQTRFLGKKLEIQIEDNGTGIPALIRQKIFEPFFTTKPAGSGTGLGLSLSYDIIVQGHGGELSVESEEGEFTRFTILLPGE
jgi:signal transduction histidine kinase